MRLAAALLAAVIAVWGSLALGAEPRTPRIGVLFVGPVLILSDQSNESQFVRKEVERAVSKTKPVLPVRIREVTPSGAPAWRGSAAF